MRQRPRESRGRRGIRGLWGGLVLTALVALSYGTPGPVCGGTGSGGGGNTTFTTSTTHHTTVSTAQDCTPHTEQTVTTTASLGPGTILIGDDQSQTFFVQAGTTNYNTNTHTETFVCIVAPIPTLSEWAQIGMAALLLGGGLLAIRRNRQLS